MYPPSLIEETVVRLLRDSECRLPPDVHAALRQALKAETQEMPRSQLMIVLTNVDRAAERSIPMCQDTGLPVFFVRGRCDHRVLESINKGVARATEEIPLRPNTVDPVSRTNFGSNLGGQMPPVHVEPADQDHLDIAVLPKGAGSENWSALRMLNPSEGMEGVRRFVIDCVVKAGSRPCPPTVVGVGVGGTADMACLLAKKALLRKLGSPNGDPVLAEMESDLFSQINSLGLGPMGLGGSTTCLGVLMEKAHCHTASLPVAVSLNCWAARKAFARVYPDGHVRFSQEGFD
ncbi:MAG TPA: fumarate hydratase [Methanomassiliicoccales archaeon]|nr:fumarate hydratase [Methanomassiliicoccales archaeon]